MPDLYDVTAIGNAIVDVIAPAQEGFVEAHGFTKGAMNLIDEAQATSLYAAMAPGIETSGGSAGNTVAGIASLGGRAAFLGKVADDQLGEVFAHDMRAIGAAFDCAPLRGGPATARSLINVTPDGQRTMCTFLGASVHVSPADIDKALIEASRIVYLEGYLFDAEAARRAFEQVAAIGQAAGRMIAMTLSDPFVVERHRDDLLAFIDQGVDLLFANEEEAKSLFRTGDFDTAVAGLRGRVKIAVVTRSEKGSVAVTADETVAVPAAPVEKVVDTTGAGDQYAAGFMFGLAGGRPLDVCARLGSMAAAEVISHYGPRPQVPLKDLAAREGY
ncbi:MAG: adenosine kinase [Phenylobacterium sp.]|jgi:sugar/nucleoside kinase (ribokinase family)|uniref:adenosine kinase n=1 Tax=Phenylobacterium sp. TaxID=1871053 RepID=UPI002A36E222|nr:adenosine kinase [Phenylobacterium sp.]MDX9998181.1 adenosine kinase [Phenylobacterium sp.]